MRTTSDKGSVWLTIVNPAGANGKVGRQWPTLHRQLKAAGLRLHVRQSEYPLHAAELVVEGVAAGYRRVLAVGGDGTNNEVINGIMQQQIVATDAITYALLPVGTGNDWIRTHGIPTKPEAWLRMLHAGHTLRQDIGLTTYQTPEGEKQRYFANIAGLAYDAYVVSVTNPGRHRIAGRFIYLLQVLGSLFRYRLRQATVLADTRSISDQFYTINIGLCRYSGGGMQFVPHAIPNDGRFAYTTAGQLSVWEVIRATPYFYNGRVSEYKNVTTGYARQLSVTHPDGAEPTLLEVDGEFLGHTPATFEILPGALRLVAPPK